jgi:UDP-N-acetylglucosamine 2-epimerase (non-hydrolysing)
MGNRAEAIKLAPVVRELERHAATAQAIVVVTAQHREMLAQALADFDITPHVDLGLFAQSSELAEFTARALLAFNSCFAELRPDVVVLQGDNTTVLAASLAAHYQGIPVAHVDAGLRSTQPRAFAPEELNRRLASAVSDLHFAPTQEARQHLLDEGIPDDHVVLAGNTVIDAMRLIGSRQTFDAGLLNVLPWPKRRVVLVTMHHRESLGDPLRGVCQALIELVAMHADVHVVMPVHPNPRVRGVVTGMLSGIPRIDLMEPLSYGDLLEVMQRAQFVMTDSGAVQEECAASLKPVLILGKSTERPEVIACGVGKLVGTDTNAVVTHATRLLDDARELARMCEGENPYGYGLASVRVVQTLLRRAPRQAGGAPVAEGPALLPPSYAVEP